MVEGSVAFFGLAGMAALLVGLSKGGLPVIGMLAVPLLALAISPVAAAALLLPIYVVSDVMGLWLYRRAFSRRNLAILTPAAILGIFVGWLTSSIVSDRVVMLLIGGIGIAFCLNNWVRRGAPPAPRPADIPRGVLWGALSGFTSFVSHAGAPTYQVYVLPQRLEKLVYAGTSTILFAIINAVKLIPYWALGQFNAGNLRLAAWLVPVSILGAYAGARLTRIIPDQLFFKAVQIALFLISLKLVFDAAFPAATH